MNLFDFLNDFFFIVRKTIMQDAMKHDIINLVQDMDKAEKGNR